MKKITTLLTIGLMELSAQAFPTITLLKHDAEAIKTFIRGKMGSAVLENERLDKYTHTASLRVNHSSIEDLNNLGSVKITNNSHINTFGILGSLNAQDSWLADGWVTGSVNLTNMHVGRIEIAADNTTLVNTQVNQDVIITDPRNGHLASITLKGTVIHGMLICKNHCAIYQSGDSSIEGGVIN